jgi:biopolymer transport protein ExbD
LNKKPLRNEDLEAAVKAIYELPREDYIMYVKAHKDLQYLKVIDALDRLSRSGVRVAALITEQMPGTESLIESDKLIGAKPAGGGQ